jgi:hypothetical protein
MELIASTVLAPWAGSLLGLTLALTMVAALMAVVYYAGAFYAVPRWILKLLGQRVMRRIA